MCLVFEKLCAKRTFKIWRHRNKSLTFANTNTLKNYVMLSKKVLSTIRIKVKPTVHQVSLHGSASVIY